MGYHKIESSWHNKRNFWIPLIKGWIYVILLPFIIIPLIKDWIYVILLLFITIDITLQSSSPSEQQTGSWPSKIIFLSSFTELIYRKGLSEIETETFFFFCHDGNIKSRNRTKKDTKNSTELGKQRLPIPIKYLTNPQQSKKQQQKAWNKSPESTTMDKCEVLCQK